MPEAVEQPRRGRKPLPEARRRTVQFRMRLTPGEWRTYCNAARQSGRSVSSIVREGAADKIVDILFGDAVKE